MLSSILIGVAAALLPAVANARNIQAKTSAATAFQAASANNVVPNYLALTKQKSAKGYNARSAAYLLNPTGGTTGLLSLFEGQEFATSITFGTESFEVIVDTGSSDTWLVETGFKCVDIQTSAPLPESACAFGPTYNISKTFKQIPNENFNITYGDGEFLTGILGYEEVKLAGITVNQTVPVVNYAAWNGDGTTSGLVGLAYPALTSAYAGTNPELDSQASQIVYDPIFTTMYKSGKILPLFSLAILRDVSGPSGYLTLGGLPPIAFVPDFVSTPILITSIEGYPKTFDFYTIEPQAIVLGNTALSGSGGNIQYIVDSGTTLNYYPTSVANAINAAFVPPAIYSEEEGVNIVPCNATAPKTGVKIAGQTLWINPLDLILETTDEDGNTICISGVVDGGSDLADDLYILGDVFQKNVVTVFDVGAGQMRFAAREYYASNDPVKRYERRGRASL